MVDRAVLFCVPQADFAVLSVVCFVGLVYPRPYFDEPAQYFSMWAPESTAVIPNGSHYRDFQYLIMTLHNNTS